jgi:hypothetical protein
MVLWLHADAEAYEAEREGGGNGSASRSEGERDPGRRPPANAPGAARHPRTIWAEEVCSGRLAESPTHRG